jgi:hypothetical protein
MRLSEAQQKFTVDIAKLVLFAESQGYALTYGDAYRSPKAHGAMGEQGPYGRAKSAHKQRLAVDFNLFVGGVWATDTEAHRPLGEYWKSLDPMNRWGGDFDDPDGNHYSREYWGIA